MDEDNQHPPLVSACTHMTMYTLMQATHKQNLEEEYGLVLECK